MSSKPVFDSNLVGVDRRKRDDELVTLSVEAVGRDVEVLTLAS